MEVAAVTLARQANAAAEEGDWRRASELYAATAQQAQPDTQGWARAVYHAWNARCHASSCDNFFCRCNGCVALPEMPEWVWTKRGWRQQTAVGKGSSEGSGGKDFGAIPKWKQPYRTWRREAFLWEQTLIITHGEQDKSCTRS